MEKNESLNVSGRINLVLSVVVSVASLYLLWQAYSIEGFWGWAYCLMAGFILWANIYQTVNLLLGIFLAFYDKSDKVISLFKGFIVCILLFGINILLLYLLWSWQVFDVKSIKGLCALLGLWSVSCFLVSNFFTAIADKNFGAAAKPIFWILLLWGIVEFLPASWSGVIVVLIFFVRIAALNKRNEE